ncbi:MAG TPA: phospholipid carrier-dependent glycosyltransferase [Xanthobacteraceae bacterium]
MRQRKKAEHIPIHSIGMCSSPDIGVRQGRGNMAVTAGDEQQRIAPAFNLGIILDFATRSHARAVAVLVLVALINFLPGFFDIPPIDRDEARFAQATKQMIESADYVDIRFQNEVRYKKPVGIYWLQAGAVQSARALGLTQALTTIWLYRIPSLAGALAAVLLTYWTALAFISRRAALTAALMMAASILLAIEARLATTDAVLLAAVVAAMGVLARLYLPEQRGRLGAASAWTLPAIFWTALAIGILVKGPLVVMVVGLAALTLVVVDRRADWLLALKPLIGVLWLAALVLPWFVAIMGRTEDAFFAESVGHDLIPKLYSNQEGHGAPPGTYFLLFWLMFFPGSMLAVLATPAVWAARREPGAKFLLAWLVPSWIILELVVTKLPHYVLPLFPAIAILIAGIIEARMLSRSRWLTPGIAWWFIFPVLLGLAGVICLIAIAHQLGLLAWLFAGGAATVGLVAWRLYQVDGAEQSLLRGMAASILMGFALFGMVIPSLEAVFPSPVLARVLRASGCPQPVAAVAVGYHEPSLVFAAGTATRLSDAAGAAEFLAGGECRFAIIEGHFEHSFATNAEAIGLRYAPGPRVEAINISTGHFVTLAVFRSERPL